MTKYIVPVVQRLLTIRGYKCQSSLFSNCYSNNMKTIIMGPSIRLLSDIPEKPQTLITEMKIQDILKMRFPSAEYIEVRDVSGGCGAMFEISVISEEFKGLSIVKQHRLVNEALKEEIKDMHGLRIHTALPSITT